MRNLSSDKFALNERLLWRPTRYHARYLRGRRAFPIRIPPTAELRRADAKFQTLKTLEPVPPKLKHPPFPLWMSLYSIRLIDMRAALRREPHHSRNVARGITRAVCRSLVADSRRRVEETSTDIRACMEPSMGGADSCGAYTILKR